MQINITFHGDFTVDLDFLDNSGKTIKGHTFKSWSSLNSNLLKYKSTFYKLVHHPTNTLNIFDFESNYPVQGLLYIFMITFELNILTYQKIIQLNSSQNTLETYKLVRHPPKSSFSNSTFDCYLL